MESGRFLNSADMPDYRGMRNLTLAANSHELHYFEPYRYGGKVYSMSRSVPLGAQAKRVAVHFEGDVVSRVKGLCFVERLGTVVLNCGHRRASDHSALKGPYELTLRVVCMQRQR